jgi:8-oxo-dGTP pyrophosphatase MutT (NUDIX family)
MIGRVGYIIMKDKRKPQIRKNVYLFELDSVRKTDEEIEVAQNALLDEIVLNGNVVVMTYNQLVDSRGFFSLLCNEKYEEKLIRLFEMGAIRISRFGDVRTVSQYLLNSVDADKEFIYSAIPIKYSQKRLLALMKRCLTYSDLSELNEYTKDNLDDREKDKLEDLFVEVINGEEQPADYLSEKDRDYQLGTYQNILKNLRGLLSTVLRISMLPDIYLDPRNESEYKELKFVNFMAAVLAFYDLPDDKIINVDAEAFRRSLGILGELEAWKNKNNNRSVYIREIKKAWQTAPERIADELSYQYAEVIVDLCYNYACENSICNISKHYNVDELWRESGDKSSFRVDFFGRFAKTWRNGAGAKDRFLTDETNKFEPFADKDDQLYKQLDRVVRLVEYIDYSQAGRADETNDQVVYRYEYKDEEQHRQNKRNIIGKIAHGFGMAALCIIVACGIELVFNKLQNMMEGIISFNTALLSVIETIVWLFVTEMLSTIISLKFPRLLPLSDALAKIRESVVDGWRICRRKFTAYSCSNKVQTEQTEPYNIGKTIPYICPAELKKYRALRKSEPEPKKYFAESSIYPIANVEDSDLTAQLIRQEELFHRKYGLVYQSKYNTMIVDPIEGENGIFPYERVLPTGKNGVVIIARYKGTFVLLKQYRHAIRRMQYAFPRGFAEEDDKTPADNAIRELQEEIHAVITKSPVFLGRIVADSGLTGGCAYVYSVDIDSLELVEDHEGIVAIEQLSDRELTSWINEGKIDDGFTLGAYALYKCVASEAENKDI